MSAGVCTSDDRPVATLKHAVAFCVRRAHETMLSKPLPRKIAIYFHELEHASFSAFRDALAYFRDNGYVFTDANEFIGDKSAQKLLYVSFDDNFASWHEALPMMAECGLKATFYVNTLPFRDTCDSASVAQFFKRIAHQGEKRTMARADLADFIRAGHTIGCHSHSHFNLAELEREAWDREIHRSKEILEQLIGKEIDAFSYPYGMRRFFSPPLRAYCARLGFRTIATGIPGLQHGAKIDPLALHRTRWNLTRPLRHNLTDLQIDGALFERITGRSAVA